MKKVAIIASHPIQYQIPLFRELTNNKIDTNIFFASRHGLKSLKKDFEFNVKFNWDIGSNMLEGYKSFFPKKQKFDINKFRLSFDGISNYLREGRFDAIIILGWSNLHYLKAFWYAKKYKIKVILRVETNLESKICSLKKYIKYFILNFIFKNVDFFLSIGKLNKKFYLHHNVPNKKILSAPYFVDNEFFNFKFKKKKLKKKLNFEKKKIILFVGKLIERKQPFEFLKLAKLNVNNLNFHFIIIGDGNLKKSCQQFIKENKLQNVSLVGFVNQKKLREYYKISDLMILTSLYETWGLTINEAFASNIPVICSNNCGCSKDLVVNGKTGFTYKIGDLKNLNKKTHLILNDKKISAQMIRNIKKKIKKYSLKYTSDSICKILNDK
jgi:glycosyltransferase involved in cell wall biosynthesis